MTYALREARFPALGARPALMDRLGRSGCPECPEFHPLPFHDLFHAERTAVVTLRDPAPVRRLTLGRSTAPGRRLLLLALWRSRSSGLAGPGAGLVSGTDPPVWALRRRAATTGRTCREVAEPWRTLAVRALGIRPVNGMT